MNCTIHRAGPFGLFYRLRLTASGLELPATFLTRKRAESAATVLNAVYLHGRNVGLESADGHLAILRSQLKTLRDELADLAEARRAKTPSQQRESLPPFPKLHREDDKGH